MNMWNILRSHLQFYLVSPSTWSLTVARLSATSMFSCETLRDSDFLVCDWSVQWTASKPQGQWERNVVWMSAAVVLGKRCVTSKKRLQWRLKTHMLENYFNWPLFIILFIFYHNALCCLVLKSPLENTKKVCKYLLYLYFPFRYIFSSAFCNFCFTLHISLLFYSLVFQHCNLHLWTCIYTKMQGKYEVKWRGWLPIWYSNHPVRTHK